MKKILTILGVLVIGIITYSLATSQTIIPTTVVNSNPLVTTSYISPASCNLFVRSMNIGSRGQDVANLQAKLSEAGYLNHVPTGYFGILTFNAVRAFQRDNGIATVGNVGPLTRTALNVRFCSNPVPPIVVDPGPNDPPMNCKVWFDGCNTCSRSYPGGPLACTEMMCIMDNNMQTSIWRGNNQHCSEYFDTNPYPTNFSPVINSISGPTQLNAGQQGTWSISASISDNSYLTYEITWGDEMSYPPMYYATNMSESFRQNSTFQHTYNNPGIYTVTVKVKSSNGQIAQSTQTVNVIAVSPVVTEPPYNCKTWFDGCNTCGRSYPGGPMYCTLMACLDQKMIPACRATF